MEQLVTMIQNAVTILEVKQLHEELVSRENEVVLVLRSASSEVCGIEAFETIVAYVSAEKQTLGFVHVARAQAWLFREWVSTHPEDDGRSLRRPFMAFLRRLEQWAPRFATEQLRLGPSVVLQLCKYVTELASGVVAASSLYGAASLAAEVVSAMAQRAEPDSTVLTPVHADALQCFLLAKRYSAAVAFAESRPILSVAGFDPLRALLGDRRPRTSATLEMPSPRTASAAQQRASAAVNAHKNAFADRRAYLAQSGLESSHLLRALYYTGLAQAALGNWPAAVDAFRACVCVPAAAASAIALAAAQKGLLCAVLANDDHAALELPKYCSALPARIIRGNRSYQRYRDFAKAVLQGGAAGLAPPAGPEDDDDDDNDKTKDTTSLSPAAAALRDNADLFHRDGNGPLAAQCLAHLRERKARQLKKIYASLTLDDVAKRLDVDSTSELRKYLEHLGKKDTSFTIDAPANALVYDQRPQADDDEAKYTIKLQAQMKHVQALAQATTLVSHHLQTSPNYIHKTNAQQQEPLQASLPRGGGNRPLGGAMVE